MDQTKRERELLTEVDRLRSQLSNFEKEKFDLTTKVANLHEEVQKRVGLAEPANPEVQGKEPKLHQGNDRFPGRSEALQGEDEGRAGEFGEDSD